MSIAKIKIKNIDEKVILETSNTRTFIKFVKSISIENGDTPPGGLVKESMAYLKDYCSDLSIEVEVSE